MHLTSIHHPLASILLMIFCTAANSASSDPSRLQLPQDARYRAIFCGAEGTETSLAYSRALAADLARLAARGHSTAESLAAIGHAACGPSGNRRTGAGPATGKPY